MKHKFRNIFIFIVFLTSLLFTTCDMVMVVDPVFNKTGSREITEAERDELEKSGHFLKLVNLPLNTQLPNIFSVSVANSLSAIGKLNKDNFIFIFKESNTCTVYLPLAYNDDKEFTETGYFYTAFSIHVDALTKYVVDVSEHFIVYYTDGRGWADVNDLPSPNSAGSKVITEKERNDLEKTGHYLKLVNMPLNTQVPNVFSVSVANSSASVANLDKNETIFIFKESNTCTVYLPLVYNDNKEFTETGYFFTAFIIHVDAITKFIVDPKDEFIVYYSDGRGEVDVTFLPSDFSPEPSYLTIKGIPLNATKHQVSNVIVYNSTSSVANCPDVNSIVFFPEDNFLTFLIPLKASSGNYFTNTGDYYISFLINIDVNNIIEIKLSDNILLFFTNGSAEFDIQSTYGFFKASLTNPDDYNKPIIAAGSSFDVNGHRAVISNNLTVPAITPESSCFLYLYAYYADNNFYYEFSNTPPVYNSSKKGWYNGIKRALWKMIYLYNTSPPKYLFKTDMNHDFPFFEKYVFENSSDYSQLTSGKSALITIDGFNNPSSQNFPLEPGIYVVELKGAGGGKGRSYNGVSEGGQGGFIREIFTLNSTSSFTAFTGSSGESAPAPSTPSGNFNIVTTKNYYSYNYTQSSSNGAITLNSVLFVNSDTISNVYSILGSNNTMSGGGGGGGGSGTFLYSLDVNYLLIAGGGGGGSGGSYLTPGGGGGSGGTVGPGSGGGGSGSFSLSSSIGTSNWNSPGGHGGKGGGLGGGNSGSVANNGESGGTVLFSNSFSSGGNGSASYSASSDFSSPLNSNFPFIRYTPVGTQGSNIFSYNGDLSNNRMFSLRTNFSISGKSGDGGSAAAIIYEDGPFSWLNSFDTSGTGASSLPLNPPVITGEITWSGSTPFLFSFSEPVISSNLKLSIGSPRDGQPGLSGGNNRNSTRGGGGVSGESGFITIYKIY